MPPRATPPLEHVPPPARDVVILLRGAGGSVASCGCLLPQGHQLHCAVGAHKRTSLARIGGEGLGSIVACSTTRVAAYEIKSVL